MIIDFIIINSLTYSSLRYRENDFPCFSLPFYFTIGRYNSYGYHFPPKRKTHRTLKKMNKHLHNPLNQRPNHPNASHKRKKNPYYALNAYTSVQSGNNEIRMPCVGIYEKKKNNLQGFRVTNSLIREKVLLVTDKEPNEIRLP